MECFACSGHVPSTFHPHFLHLFLDMKDFMSERSEVKSHVN